MDFDNFSPERTTDSGNSFLGRTKCFLSFSQAFQERHNFNPVFHKNALEYIRKILDPSRTDLECNSFDFNIYQEYTRSVYMAEIKAYGDATRHTGTRRIILHGNAAPRESHYHFMAPIYGNQFDLSANHESGGEYDAFQGFGDLTDQPIANLWQIGSQLTECCFYVTMNSPNYFGYVRIDKVTSLNFPIAYTAATQQFYEYLDWPGYADLPFMSSI